MVKSNVYYVGYYLLMTILTIAAINVLSWAVSVYAPYLLNSAGTGLSGMGAVAILIPPMQTGNRFYTLEKRHMTRTQGWTLAVFGTTLWLTLVVGGTIALSALMFGNRGGEFDLGAILHGGPAIAWIMGALVILILLANKVLMWAAIRGQIKGAENRAARAAKKAAGRAR